MGSPGISEADSPVRAAGRRGGDPGWSGGAALPPCSSGSLGTVPVLTEPTPRVETGICRLTRPSLVNQLTSVSLFTNLQG